MGATPEKEWIAHVDGSANKRSCGAGVVIRTPIGEKVEYSVHFMFWETNNASEYEALLAGIWLSKVLGASRVHFQMNSRLVANQVRYKFVSKKDLMAAYVTEARSFLG